MASKTILCPISGCGNNSSTDEQFYQHFFGYHSRENINLRCPICKDNEIKGDYPYGFGSHLFHCHSGETIEQKKERRKKEKQPTYAFALVVCRHPISGKYLLVEETCKQGWWLPGGRVDPGETFEEAAIRETKEEGGIDIRLKGVLRIEYSPSKRGGGRQRIIFLAEPTNVEQQPKWWQDFESSSAKYVSYEDMKELQLRGREPLMWFSYVHNNCPVMPMEFLTLESQYEKAPCPLPTDWINKMKERK